jgi:large subunit ribosomal protein L21
MKFAVIRAGGKQYIVSENEEVVVDNLNQDVNSEVEFERLAEGDLEKETITLGNPVLKAPVKGTLLENLKGEKIRVARYKAKTRYRKVTGFRPMLSRVKIVSI